MQVRELNSKYRDVVQPTDVLSFCFNPVDDPMGTPPGQEVRDLGDMVLGLPYIERWAIANGVLDVVHAPSGQPGWRD